ncbi:LysR substrate-binding domain-containing protein [Streptomyces sp. NPDC005526]|uniref:LysR family transcriptional regulator n=1 Tax=Streptomyces sp. NPDC005526 TaxID=3156885 RepID=UPI0033BE78C1
MDVHLRDLRYFVAVAEELHFTRAAERLYVSQPALSKQIRALERQLGFQLFERQRRQVELTPQGEALLTPARHLLADWQEALQTARGAVAPVSLTVGMQTAVGRDVQRDVLAGFRDRGWHITLRLVAWDDPSAGLADGTCDLAFVWLPLPGAGFATRTLVRERVWVALPVGHRMADRTEIDFDELAGEPFIALPRSAGPLRDFWLATTARAGRTPRIGAEAGSTDEVLEAVASGQGVALIAEGNVGLYQRPDLVYRPVLGLPEAELAIAWRATDRRPEVSELVAALTNRTGPRPRS